MRPANIILLGLIGFTLCGCGGGGGGGEAPPTYSVTANVSGLSGSGLALTFNGGAPVAISGNGTVTLASALANGASYSVSITASPVNPSETCTISSNTGTVSSANVQVNVSCTTANTPPTSTQASLDSSVPDGIKSVIAAVVTPSAKGSLGSWLPITTNTPTGQSLILALDANNNIVLSAVTTSYSTTLSADSTALSLTRIAIGDIATSQSASAIDSAIRADPGYTSLVTAIQNALNANVAPTTDSAVLQALANVVSPAIARVSSAAGSRANIKALVSPILQSPNPIVLPITVLSDQVIGTLPVQIDSSGPHAVGLSNHMPIPWVASSTDASGATLEENAWVSSNTLLALGSGSIFSSTAGFNLTLEQNSKTHGQIVADLVSDAISIVTGFNSLSGEGAGCNLTALNAAIAAAAEVNFDGATWAAVRSAFGQFLATESAEIAKECGANSFVTEALSAVSQLQQALTLAKTAYKLGSALTEIAYAANYWSNPPATIGVCESAQGAVVNCAAAYQFTPAEVILAPGATTTPVLTAKDNRGNPTGVPSGLTYTPDNTPAFSIDHVTGAVTATSQAAGTPTSVTVTDLEGSAQGTLSVGVVVPQITPATATALVGGGPSDIVTFTLTDASGKSVIVPPGVSWSSDDPTGVHLTNFTALTDPYTTGKSSWYSPAGATPGQVTITAKAPDGSIYGSATITVTAVVLAISPSTPTVAVGSTVTLSVSATDASGNPIALPPKLQWTSSDTSLATVSANVVTGKAAGSPTITVKDLDSGATASVVVTVNSPWVGTWVGEFIDGTGCGNTTVPATYVISQIDSQTLAFDGPSYGVLTLSANGMVATEYASDGSTVVFYFTLSGNTITLTNLATPCQGGVFTRQ
jgi:hypothetical protein